MKALAIIALLLLGACSVLPAEDNWKLVVTVFHPVSSADIAYACGGEDTSRFKGCAVLRNGICHIYAVDTPDNSYAEREAWRYGIIGHEYLMHCVRGEVHEGPRTRTAMDQLVCSGPARPHWCHE